MHKYLFVWLDKAGHLFGPWIFDNVPEIRSTIQIGEIKLTVTSIVYIHNDNLIRIECISQKKLDNYSHIMIALKDVGFSSKIRFRSPNEDE